MNDPGGCWDTCPSCAPVSSLLSRRGEWLHSPPGAGVCPTGGAQAVVGASGVLVLAPSSASWRLWSCDTVRCLRWDPVTMAAFSGPRFAICSGDNAWEEKKAESHLSYWQASGSNTGKESLFCLWNEGKQPSTLCFYRIAQQSLEKPFCSFTSLATCPSYTLVFAAWVWKLERLSVPTLYWTLLQYVTGV